MTTKHASKNHSVSLEDLGDPAWALPILKGLYRHPYFLQRKYTLLVRKLNMRVKMYETFQKLVRTCNMRSDTHCQKDNGTCKAFSYFTIVYFHEKFIICNNIPETYNFLPLLELYDSKIKLNIM
jgi:hypothetical protein